MQLISRMELSVWENEETEWDYNDYNGMLQLL